jgi:hypothetical protein
MKTVINEEDDQHGIYVGDLKDGLREGRGVKFIFKAF